LYFLGSFSADVTWNTDRSTGDVDESLLVYDLDLVTRLLNPDGLHPWWINLSPFGVINDSTLFDVSFSTDFTDRVFIGADSFPGEPFHLLGPTLPASWREGEPYPPIVLPSLSIRRRT
jgi:hypothetical protein